MKNHSKDRYLCFIIVGQNDKFPFIGKLQSIKSEAEEEIKYVDMPQMWKRV